MTRSHAAWHASNPCASARQRRMCHGPHAPLPSPAPPCGHGRSSNPRLFHPSGRGGAERGFDAPWRIAGTGLPLSSRPHTAFPSVGRSRTCQEISTGARRVCTAGRSKVLAHLTGIPPLMASLLSGSGLRLMACVRLRVKDVDCAYHHLTVRDPQGAHDRVTRLLQSLEEALHRQPPAFQNRPSRGPRAREPLRTSPSPMQCGLDRPRCAPRRQADARAAAIVA